jgi:hypothetical protein
MKTQIYTWRLSADLKTDLAQEARRRKMSLSAVLDLAARDWLNKSGVKADDDEEQKRLHAAASKCFGALAGGDPHRSEKVSEIMRDRLRKQHGR